MYTNLTPRRQQNDKNELGECYFGQPLKSEARTTVSSAQLPSTAPRDNVTMISEAQFEVNEAFYIKQQGVRAPFTIKWPSKFRS